MRFIAWNCRGLVKSLIFNYLRRLVRSYNSECIFIFKIKTSSEICTYVRRRLVFFNSYSIPVVDNTGGMCLIWKLGIQLSITSLVHHIISLEFCNIVPNGKIWNMLCYYSPSYEVLKDYFWTNLIALISISNYHWICLGDLNEILSQNEKKRWLIYSFLAK